MAAAAEPLSKDLHEALKSKARAFANIAPKLDNQLGWTGIGRSARRFSALIDCDTSEVPKKLGQIWNELVALGSFLDLDNTVRAAPDSFASPLDPEALRPLKDLIRTGGPWLRLFPTARRLDDESGSFLTRKNLLDPSYDIFRRAGGDNLLRPEDVEAIKDLVDAARRGDFQGDKARARAVFSAKNLVTAVCAFYVGAMNNDFATHSVLAQRGASLMLEAESSVMTLFSDSPDDIRQALRLLLDNLPTAPTLPETPRVESTSTLSRRREDDTP